MFLRQSLPNKYSYVYRKATCMQKRSFYLKQNKMAKTHSCSNLVPVTVTDTSVVGDVTARRSKMHGEFVSLKQRPVRSFIELTQQLPEFLRLCKPAKHLSLALQQRSP